MDYPYGEGRRAEEPMTPRKAGSECCVVRNGDTYVEGNDGRLHQPLCKSVRDEKAERGRLADGNAREKEHATPATLSASNTRADPKPCLRCARYGVKAIEGHT